jgi:hypothetical protein
MRCVRFIVAIGIALVAVTAGPLSAQNSQADKKLISGDELKKFCIDVAAFTAQAVELRKKSAGLPPRDLVKEAEQLRQQLEAVVLTIAATRPAPADQRAAMLLAMGTKGAELALWHYIYGVMANSPKATEYGDVLVKTAADQIDAARQIFQNGKI